MLARLRSRPRRGAATVEFAAVAPVLFLLVAGFVEVGRLVMVAQLATNSSREAARYAVQADAKADAVRTYTETYLAAAGIPATAVKEITIEQQKGDGWEAVGDPSGLGIGTPVRVTLSIDFDRVSWLPTRFFVGDKTAVTGVTVMRKE